MCPSPCVRHLTWASVRRAPLLCPVLHCSLSPGRWAAVLGLLAVTGFLLSSDLVSNKIIHFDCSTRTFPCSTSSQPYHRPVPAQELGAAPCWPWAMCRAMQVCAFYFFRNFLAKSWVNERQLDKHTTFYSPLFSCLFCCQDVENEEKRLCLSRLQVGLGFYTPPSPGSVLGA